MDWLGVARREMGSLLLAGLAVGALLLLARGAWRYLRRRQWWEMRERKAWWLFFRGEDLEAERMFVRLGASAGWGMRKVKVRLGLGLCRLARFEFAEALEVLEPLGRSWGLRRRGMRYFFKALPGEIAVCRAMVGDLEGAKRWLAEGYRRCGGFEFEVLLPEVLILCREGQYGAAVKVLDEGWGMSDWCAGPPHLMRLLRAYALDRIDAPSEGKEEEMRFLMLYVLSVYDPALETLVAYWPELGPFIKRWEPIIEGIMGRAPWRYR